MSSSAFFLLLVCGAERTFGAVFSAKRSCSPVPPPLRGNVSCFSKKDAVDCGSKHPPGSVASFRCRDRYAPEGEAISKCFRNGTWIPPPPKCLPDCGKRSSSVSLVVNGAAATPGAFPWHVAIYRRFGDDHEYWCGGSLVSEHAVVTAAHCAWNVHPEELLLAFGKFDREFGSDERHVQKIRAKRIEKLESYQDAGGNYNGDVCVVFLETPVRLDSFSSPICLDWNQEFVNGHLAEGTLGLVLGWGLTENDTLSDRLRMLKLPVVSDAECLARQRQDFKKFVTYTTFCAGFLNGTGACNGDSGGGLAFFDEDSARWYLQGVVSVSPRRTGTSFCDPRFYTVFTKVSAFTKWLKTTLLDEEEEDDGRTIARTEEEKSSSKPSAENDLRRLYAFVRKYFGRPMREPKQKKVFFPHSERMLEAAGLL